MAPKDRWDAAYADCFKGQPEGWALYKQFSLKQLKPGMCGYFDEQGDWQPIVDLAKPSEVTKKEYSSINGIKVSEDPGKQGWLFRKSAYMYRFDPKISGSVETPGLPAGGGITVGYKSSTGRGAILVTEGDVKHTQANPPYKMCEWMTANGKAVLANNPDAKSKGIWIITKTYSVKRRALAVLLSKESEVTLSISASADKVGKVEATAEWWESRVGGAWNTQADENGVVLAMDGIYWKAKWWSSSVRPVTAQRDQTVLRGEVGEVVISPMDFALQEDQEKEPLTVELEPVIMGTVEGIRLFDPEIDQDSHEGGDGGEDETDDD